MAKMFYSAAEAAQKIGRSEDQLKDLVREGKLREFRDAGKVNYKVEDVDAVVAKLGPASAAKPAVAAASKSAAGRKLDSGGSAIADIILEPAEDSAIELSPSGSDVISLAETDSTDTRSGTTAVAKAKGDTVVPSVGVNVFDEDELDEHVDPLAQTAVTDVAGLGIEGAGSGSGILDLTRESDDTSLGKDLLDSIYTPADEAEAEEEEPAAVEMGEATRAGLDQAIPAEEEEAEPAQAVAVAADPGRTKAIVREVVDYGPDIWSTSLTALMVVGTIVMLVAGLGTAAMVRSVTPGLVQLVYSKLWIFSAGALLAGAAAVVITYLLMKRRAG